MNFTNQLIFFNERVKGLAFNDENTKEYLLFESFKDNFDKKDKQRKKQIYGNGTLANVEINFRKLKSRVGKKALAGFLISEFDNVNFSLEKFRSLYFIFQGIAKLSWTKDIHTTAAIFEKLFTFSFKYKFSLQCRDLSYDLYNIFTSYKPNTKKANFYKAQALIWKEQCEFYYEVEEFRLEMVKHYFGDIKDIDKELIVQYMEKVSKLKEIMPQILDIEINEVLIDIICFIYGHARNYEGIIDEISNFSKYKESYKLYKKTTEWTIHYNLLLAHINLKKYDEANHNLENLYSFLTKGGRYWNIIKGIEFNLLIKTIRYKDAYSVASEVFVFTNMLDTIDATIWQMKLAYITLIHEVLKFDIVATDFKLPDFDIKKFISRTKPLVHDKSGYNLNIKIIKILFYLTRNDTDKAYDEIEYFNVYKNKYIKKDENPRSRLFIAMLLSAAQSGFHPVRTSAHVKKTYDKLSKTEFVTSSEYVNNEIIPYEFLWEVIMTQLEKNRKL